MVATRSKTQSHLQPGRRALLRWGSLGYALHLDDEHRHAAEVMAGAFQGDHADSGATRLFPKAPGSSPVYTSAP